MASDLAKVRFRASIEPIGYLPGQFCIVVPAGVVQKLGGGFRRRVVCAVNDAVTFSTGLMARGGGRAYINITKKRMKEAGVPDGGGTASIRLVEDKSRYGMPIPEELEELLRQDDEGRSRFEALPMGKQRYILYYVNGVKHPDRRLERAIRMMENLKRAPQGKETFRHLLGMSPHPKARSR